MYVHVCVYARAHNNHYSVLVALRRKNHRLLFHVWLICSYGSTVTASPLLTYFLSHYRHDSTLIP